MRGKELGDFLKESYRTSRNEVIVTEIKNSKDELNYILDLAVEGIRRDTGRNRSKWSKETERNKKILIRI